MRLTLQCLFSPRLYKIYSDGPRDSLYQPNLMERWGDKIISSAQMAWSIGVYTSPFICMYMYRRGMYTLEQTKSMLPLISSLGCILTFSFIVRGIGRAMNPKYAEFLRTLNLSNNEQKVYLDGLRKYDFDFAAWPVTYSVAPKRVSSGFQHPFQVCANPELPIYKRVVVQLLACIATYTFGLRLIYPGTLGLIHSLLGSALLQGRVQLVEQHGGKRAKVRAADGNTIDTMFVDARPAAKGRTLVVCCEGNSGFYEVGIMTTPIRAGYSALGWNHPGFATSSGLPFPSQERNAMDAVMQYAINELGFDPRDIIVFGWSIGGYTASWAAAHYPDVKGLVLDATFDDLLPLAQNHMPASWGTLVKEVVRSYVDLDVASQLRRYDGPVRLVRRTSDEIICLTPGQIATNRGNNLLLKLLESRHPAEYGAHAGAFYKYVGLVDGQRASILAMKPDEKVAEPLRLISRYLIDYQSSHNTALPEDEFEAAVSGFLGGGYRLGSGPGLGARNGTGCCPAPSEMYSDGL